MIEPGFDPCMCAGVMRGTAPGRAGGGSIEPGYRVDAPLAARETTDTGACPASAPQCRAAT
jgi:hypothetical protein